MAGKEFLIVARVVKILTILWRNQKQIKIKGGIEMEKRFFNGEELTKESILKARKFFSDNRLACIENVKSGKTKIYCDKEEFYEREERNSKDDLDGVNDHTFTFLQRAYYIQTGKSVALFQDK